VSFYADSDSAQRDGYRPCKRCRPDLRTAAIAQADAIAHACRTIETADSPPSLAALARAAGWSSHHFLRMFQSVTGVTPRAYAQQHRVQRLQQSLSQAPRITDAIYASGYNSSGRFYEAANDMLGMTPGQYRKRARGVDIRFALAQCSLGAVLVAATPKGVCAILLGDDPEALLCDLQARFADATLHGAEPDFEALVARVIALVERPRLPHDLPLDILGTAFQQRVWEALRAIPPGKTATYTQIAQHIGAPRAVRAVAAACAANPLAVAVPCHRVVRLDGDLAGYRWGLARKQQLLERERDVSTGGEQKA